VKKQQIAVQAMLQEIFSRFKNKMLYRLGPAVSPGFCGLRYVRTHNHHHPMTHEIINAGQDPKEIQVDLGTGQLVSMQTVQHIYNEITGQSEELSRNYSINHSVSFDDLKQLHIKICQLHEQYNIASKNSSVTLYHVDDQKQAFSSFERFELFDRTTLSPVENVELNYNFLIVLPQVNKPQSYQIEINIKSRAAIAMRARTESAMPDEVFFQFFTRNTARMEIRYVDYTVARNFQHAIDGWFKALPLLPHLTYINAMRRFSQHFAFALRFASIAIFLTVCFLHFSSDYWGHSSSIASLYLAAFVTFGGMFVLSVLSGKLGSVLGDAIRRIQGVCYLNLTRGDQLALDELNNANQRSWYRAAATLFVAIAVNVLSSWLVAKLGLDA